MTIRVTTAPPYYPLSRDEAKVFCRVDDGDTSQDAVIDMLIAALTDHAENKTGRSFVQRSYELLLDCFPWYQINIPQPPLLTIDSVKYYDSANVLQTLSPSLYAVDIYHEPGRLQPAYGEAWPVTYGVMNAVQIAFTAGYAPGSPTGAAAYREALPANLKLWLNARISTLYENREQLIRNNQVEIPRDFADGLLDSLVVGARLF